MALFSTADREALQDVCGQYQMVDQSGIGDDEPHQLESQLFQGVAILVKIFHGVVFLHVTVI